MTTTFAHQEPTDSQLANAINAAHEACRLSAQSAIEHARHAGDLLIKAKHELAHGEWLPWLAKHCPTISQRTAQAYMRIARGWPEVEAARKTQRVADLPMRDALRLLSMPSIEFEEDIERLASAARAELSMLQRALDSPDLTIHEAEAIVRRSAEIEGAWFERRIRALHALGLQLNAVAAEYGQEFADLMASDPDAVIKAATFRMAQLEALQ